MRKVVKFLVSAVSIVGLVHVVHFFVIPLLEKYGYIYPYWEEEFADEDFDDFEYEDPDID